MIVLTQKTKTNSSFDAGYFYAPYIPITRTFIPKSMKIPLIVIDDVSYNVTSDGYSLATVMLSSNGRQTYTSKDVDIFVDCNTRVNFGKKFEAQYAVIVFKGDEMSTENDLMLTIRPKDEEVLDWVDSEIFEQVLINNYERFRDIHCLSVI